jgi:hypothetical protein
MSGNGDRTISYGNEWLRSLKDKTIPWIWDGLVAEEAITLLSAPEKTGKTTLLSLLLDRRRTGGQLLGRTVSPGGTILCSEEHSRLWELRQPPLDFGSQLEFHEPQRSNPTPRRWRRYIDHLLDIPGDAFDLLVIDTVMTFLPARQNDPEGMRKALHELRVVAGQPAGVLLLHQTSAARARSGARGPLAALCDILIDMQIPPGNRFTRRRHFFGVGRYPGTLQHVAAELNAEGTDYLVLPDDPLETVAPTLETIRQLLSESPSPLAREEILARWPDPKRPHTDSLARSLARGCELGVLIRTGEGVKGEAFRFGLAEEGPPD